MLTVTLVLEPVLTREIGLFVGFQGYFHGKEQVKYNKGTVIKDF